jgi:hypothetical protein
MPRFAIRALGVAACLGLAGSALAREVRSTTLPAAPGRDAVREKAELVLEIARYVDWPPGGRTDATAPFVVGVLGDDPLRAELGRRLAGQRIHGRPVQVRLFTNLDEVEPCPVLFVGREKARLLPVILDFLGGASVLTVGEPEDFLELGGIVRLVDGPDRVAFEINLDGAERRRLRLSAPLLQHAQRVLEGEKAASGP